MHEAFGAALPHAPIAARAVDRAGRRTGLDDDAAHRPARRRPQGFSGPEQRPVTNMLGRRLAERLLRTVLPGDVMAKWPAGGMFVARDVAAEQARFDARETVHAGPMFGRKTFPAEGIAAEREAAVLHDAGLTIESFAGFGKLLMGTRRHNLVYVIDLAAAMEADGLWLTFTLQAGSYATVLLRQVMKSEVGDDGAEASAE